MAMKQLTQKAKIIDMIARIEALESVFWGYIKAKEDPMVYTEMKKQFHEFYLEVFDEQINTLKNPMLAAQIKHEMSERLQDMDHETNKFMMFASLDELDLKKDKSQENLSPGTPEQTDRE